MHDLPDPGAFFEALADAYIVLDATSRIVFVNQRYLALVGTSRESLMGSSIFDVNQYGSLAQRTSRTELIQALLRRLEPGHSRSSAIFRADWPSQGGEIMVPRFWQVHASHICLPGTTNTYFTLRVNDVTAEVERDESEKREKARLRSQAQLRQIIAAEKDRELQESREQLSEALAFARVGAWQLDFATGVIDCTEQCKLNLGIDPGTELTERRLFEEVIANVDRERVREELGSAISEKRDYKAEYRLQQPSFSQRWILAGGRTRYDESGQPAQMVGYTLDITARKEQELTQERIAGDERLARERSEENTRAMDHFLSTVSHELRSPIGVILTWTELLAHTDTKTSASRAAETIQRNAKQLAFMVDDLLDSGAIVTGKLSIEFAHLSLDTVAREVVDDFRLQAQRKRLALTSERLDLCFVQGDAARVKQIAWNLINNAIKFTEVGEIDVSVYIEDRNAVLRVRDTGRGIAQDALPKIFERFEQIRPKSTGRAGGLGLGLWLVKTLVERHHGHIEVSSDGEGRGATFLVRLPLEDSAA